MSVPLLEESIKVVKTPREIGEQDDLKDFLIVLRRALLLIVRWIEGRYSL